MKLDKLKMIRNGCDQATAHLRRHNEAGVFACLRAMHLIVTRDDHFLKKNLEQLCEDTSSNFADVTAVEITDSKWRFCLRLFKFLRESSIADGRVDPQYQRGWNDAMAHIKASTKPIYNRREPFAPFDSNTP